MLYYAMTLPEDGRQSERSLYTRNIEDIVAYPEAYGYRSVSLTPEPLDEKNFRVGLIAALPTNNPRVYGHILDNYTNQFCYTTLCLAFLRTNRDPALRKMLVEISEREVNNKAATDRNEQDIRRGLFYPNTIAVFLSPKMNLSPEPIGVNFLVPSNTRLIEAYDETVRMMVSILDSVETAVAYKQ